MTGYCHEFQIEKIDPQPKWENSWVTPTRVDTFGPGFIDGLGNEIRYPYCTFHGFIFAARDRNGVWYWVQDEDAFVDHCYKQIHGVLTSQGDDLFAKQSGP